MNDTLTTPIRYRVPALERGLRILELLRHAGPELTPPAIARSLALPRTTVFRLLQTLEDLGFVERAGTRSFRLGVTAIALAADARENRAEDGRRALHACMRADHP